MKKLRCVLLRIIYSLSCKESTWQNVTWQIVIIKKKSARQKSHENGIKEFGTVVENQKTNWKSQSSFFLFEK